MAPAVPYLIVGGLGYMQYQQQGAAGKYNQAIQNRNAQIAEQEAAQIDKQLEFDLGRFDQKFDQLQGQTTTRILKTGADLSGSGLKVLRANAQQAELEKILWSIMLKLVKQKNLKKQIFIEYRDKLLDKQQEQLKWVL